VLGPHGLEHVGRAREQQRERRRRVGRDGPHDAVEVRPARAGSPRRRRSQPPLRVPCGEAERSAADGAPREGGLAQLRRRHLRQQMRGTMRRRAAAV
jgi:hypothetical protein